MAEITEANQLSVILIRPVIDSQELDALMCTMSTLMAETISVVVAIVSL